MRLLIFLISLVFYSNVQAEDVQQDFDGFKVNAHLVTTGEDWTKQPLVLMTHGTLAHGKMEIMSSLQETLKERGVSSLSITLSMNQSDRQGMFDCTELHAHTHRGALDNINVWIKWLEDQGVQQIFLLGHSRGGNQTALFHKEISSPLVKGLVLVAPMTWDMNKAVADYQEKYNKPLDFILKRTRKQPESRPGFTRIMFPTDFLYCKEAKVTPDAFLSYYDNDPDRDTPHLLSKITDIPVLVFAGSEDQSIPDLAEKMQALDAQQNIRFELIDGAGHFFRDLYSEDLADLIAEFMSAPSS